MIRRLLITLGRDYVLLRTFEGRHRMRPVRWVCGRPFAAPYLAETAAQLLPEGKLDGVCYLEGWLPASPRMEAFFAGSSAALASAHEGQPTHGSAPNPHPQGKPK